MLNLHRDKIIVRREPGRDGKILCDHRQDGNDEVIGTLVPTSMCRLLSVSVDGISTHTLVLTLQSASFPLAELWHNSFSHNSVVSYTR